MIEWLLEWFEPREAKLARAKKLLEQSEREIKRAQRKNDSELQDVEIDIKNARFLKNEVSLRAAFQTRELFAHMQQRYLTLLNRVSIAKANLMSDVTETQIHEATRLGGDVLIEISRRETLTDRSNRVDAAKMAREVVRLEREDREEDENVVNDQSGEQIDERVEQMMNEVRDEENLALLDAVSVPASRKNRAQQQSSSIL